MADTSAEKLQNMNIQDFDGSEFDPFSPQNKVANMNNVDQPVDLLGGFVENGQMTNGSDKHVSFDQEAGIGLPDPSYINQGQGQIPGFEGQKIEGLQRNMSEGEILGYQNEYGESVITGQMEYGGSSDEENLIDIPGTDVDSYPKGQGYLPRVEAEEYSSPDPSQNLYEQYVENDYAGDNEAGVKVVEETFDSPNDYDNDETDPDSWRPEMDPERLRRSLTPERSVSPYVKSESFGDVDSDIVSSPSEMSHREPASEPVGVSSDRELSIPKSEGVETPDLVSQGSQQISSEETESLDSRSETDSTPRRRRIPKPKTKKPLELPPWDDNVVIPKPPRMKPTLIGKQADLPPPSPPRFHRPYTAPARHNAKDASSDSGVEEESKSPRKSSGDMKKKYGIDTKNTGYRPGGGNVQVFSQKIDTKSITPRTDTTKPRSALSPRVSPSKEKSPAIPKAPTPNTRHAQSKIGSLNNVKHSPGGGNVKVLNAKVDFSNVSSKVGSKDKIDHKPKGGDKKIETQKLTWQKESKVGSLKNVTHAPGGGNVKDGVSQGQGTMNTRENIHYHPGGGNIPDPYEENLDWDVDAKVNTLDNLDYEPGGGCVKIFSEKLNWKAEPKVDTGLYRRSENVSFNQDSQRYDSTKQQVAITIEPVPDRFNHTFLEPVPEVEYQSAADVRRNQSDTKQVEGTLMESVAVANDEVDKTDGFQTDCDETNKVFGQSGRQKAPPPPKPHKCIHKQLELEIADESVESNKPYEREILTFTKEELEEILRKKDLDDHLEKEYNEPFKCLDEQNVDIDKKIEEGSEDRRSNQLPGDMPVRNITSEEDLKNVSVDHKEETFIIEREVIRKLSGKENKAISKKSNPKEKSGFVNKVKSLFTSKGKDEKKDRKSKRFSSTSFNINRSSSNSSRISITGKKLKQCAAEEEKEIELMVKYLGYHSPKLARKSFIEQDKDSGDLNSKQEKKQQQLQKKSMEKVEKLANLGYQSPKLADRKGKPVIMTGSPRQKRKAEMDGKGIRSETARQFDNEGERVGCLGKESVTKIHVKEGIHSDYQDIDFGANVSDIKNGKTKAIISYSNTMSDNELLLEKESRNNTSGIMNEGYEYDDVASDEDTDHSGIDIEDVSEEERHTSIAEININSNRGSKKSIQTTTFKYKMNERPTSPLNEIKQQMIETVEQNLSTVEDRADVEREITRTCNMPKAYSRTTHDQFGYAVVHKVENGSLLEKEDFERGMEMENDNIKLAKSLQNQESYTEASTKSQDNRKSAVTEFKCKTQKKTKPPLEDSENEITLEKELKAVLANIQDNEGNFLKSPRRYEGTETGSRPGTPKIPVKPLWMKAEEEGRYGLRRYMSDENLSRPSKQGFVRSNKTQSMMVRKKGQLSGVKMFESGSGAVEMKSEIDSLAMNSEDGNNLARSFNMVKLSCTDQLKSTHSVDDLRQDVIATASYKAGNSFSNIHSRKEKAEPVSSSLNRGHVTASENSGLINSEMFSGSVHAGVSQNIELEKCMFDKKVLNSESIVDKREKQQPSSSADHATDLVVNQRLSWSAKSRVGSLDNASHSPGGGKVKILDQKIEIKAQSKVGSTANIKHKPGGGDKKIETQKLEFKESARSKVGSMDKVKHKPGGGDIKIFTESPKWETTSKVKSLENAKHVPGGGSVKIVDEKPVWMAAPKVESLVNADHVPGGGKVKILDEKVDFTQTAKPKVGSMDKVKHQPGGGDKKIETQKLNFKETARARTDTGASSGERRSSSDPQGSGSVTSSQDGSVQE